MVINVECDTLPGMKDIIDIDCNCIKSSCNIKYITYNRNANENQVLIFSTGIFCKALVMLTSTSNQFIRCVSINLISSLVLISSRALIDGNKKTTIVWLITSVGKNIFDYGNIPHKEYD